MVDELQLRLKESIVAFELICCLSPIVMAQQAEEPAAMNITEARSHSDVHNYECPQASPSTATRFLSTYFEA